MSLLIWSVMVLKLNSRLRLGGKGVGQCLGDPVFDVIHSFLASNF